MSVSDAQNTNFFLAFHPEHDTGDWAKAVAASEPVGFSRTWVKIEVGGQTLRQNGPDAPLWYWPADNKTLTSVPADLTEFLSNNPAWTPAMVRIFNNVVATDDARRPRLGEYVGRGRFKGCTATISIQDVETGRICITLTGTFVQFGAFYAAILSRKVKPTQWHEPKPHWVKPRWLKAIIGYRGHEPETAAAEIA